MRIISLLISFIIGSLLLIKFMNAEKELRGGEEFDYTRKEVLGEVEGTRKMMNKYKEDQLKGAELLKQNQ